MQKCLKTTKKLSMAKNKLMLLLKVSTKKMKSNYIIGSENLTKKKSILRKGEITKYRLWEAKAGEKKESYSCFF